VKRGEIKERADVVFFASSNWLARSPFPRAAVGDYFDVRDGDHNRLPDEEITSADVGIRYLRAQDLRDGEIVSEDPIYITPKYFATVKRSHIKPGYLLFSIMASIGNSAVVPAQFPPATANRAVGILVPRLGGEDLSGYLFHLFRTDLGAQLYARIKKGGLQQRTNLADVVTLEFPLPPSEVRRKLVAGMQAARRARKQKLREADQLLASLDTYLLETLRLTPPPPDDRQTYAVRLKAIRHDDRLNADYFHPERILTLLTLQQTASARLDELVKFHRDLRLASANPNYIGLAHVQRNTGELVASDEEAEGQCFEVLPGDVLFARLRPYLNKVYRAERKGVCSTEFHVMRVKDSNAILPEYLATMLRSSLIVAQTRHMMTGNTHPRLTNNDVVNLVVPIPSLKVQQQIAAEGRRRREQARLLRSEAEADWKKAKRRFEQQFLGVEQH